MDLLLQRRAQIRAREIDFPTARLLHLLANAWMRGKDDPEIPLDQFIMNEPFSEADPEELRRQGMDQLKGFVKMLGGEVNL